MARETFKDFLRSGNYNILTGKNPEGMIQYTLESLVASTGGPDRSGLAFEFNSGIPLVGFDAVDPDVGLIGNFLHYITTENGNFYEFNKGNRETFSGKRGDYLPAAENFIASNPYLSPGTILESQMSKYSNSRYFDDPNTGSETEDIDELFSIINKVDGSESIVLADPSKRLANDLLKGVEIPIESDDPEDYVVQASVAALKRNSRFNMDDEFYENPSFLSNSDAEDEEGNSIPSIDNEEDYLFVRDEDEYFTSFQKLKEAGASLLLKASGYDTTPGPIPASLVKDLENKIFETDVGIVEENESAVSMPSDVSGEEVPKLTAESLRGRNATGVPNILLFSSRAGKGALAGNTPSFGTTYNHALRFEDLTPTHKIKTALRMITLFTLLKSLYEDIMGELASEDKKEIAGDIKKIASSPNNGLAGELLAGLSRKSNKFILHNYLFDNFLTPTDYSYEACFSRGIKVIFGSDSPSNAEDVSGHLHDIYNSPGFWLAMSNTAIKKTFKFKDDIERLAIEGQSGQGTRDALKSIFGGLDSVAKIANVFAIIGEKSLHYTNGLNENGTKTNVRVSNVRDVDTLDNIPGNRVGKSRKKKNGQPGARPDLGSATTLAWEQSDVPSAYILPLNVLRAAADLNNSYTRVNPLRGMVGSRLVRNTYTGLDTDGSSARIPGRVVKILEDRLDAEYVPFYIQDLRTNEIISFHAFLSQLTDTITPNFTATPGYGRIDPVQTYQSTTRSIQVGFTLYSTNREDFDDMWYKINKFVTLLYPQWTQGAMVQVGNPDSDPIAESTRFVQPFTQKIGASPIVRLRVGDIVKSNYSRFALARTFGIGDPGVQANPIGYGGLNVQAGGGGFLAKLFRTIRDVGISIYAAVFGSYQGLLQIGSDAVAGEDLPGGGFGNAAANVAFDAAAEALAEVLVNGFANPILVLDTLNNLRDPNFFDAPGFARPTGAFAPFVYLNPNMIDGYAINGEGGRIFTTKRVLARVEGTVDDEIAGFDQGTGSGERQSKNKLYKVKIEDKSDSSIFGKIVHVAHKDIWNDPAETFSKSPSGLIFAGAGTDLAGLIDIMIGNLSKSGGGGGFGGDLLGELNSLVMENLESAFMRPEVNPYVRAFHTTRGRGLAGVIKGVSFNWLDDFPWETDHNARAPIGCNINFSFDVIHDIPPGLDHTGYNRAPLYNVGEVMRNVAGDVYGEKFSKSERKFRQGGAVNLAPGSANKKRG